MAEYTPANEGAIKEGHIPRTEVALLELHRLLAIFLSSRSFAELRIGEDSDDPISWLQVDEDNEITRILLMLAVTGRVVDDREQRVFDFLGFGVGKLQKDLRVPEVVDLTLREACNKIIHAQKLRFDIDRNERGVTYFNPIIYLYGTHLSAEWKATLDIVEFAKEYASLMRHY